MTQLNVLVLFALNYPNAAHRRFFSELKTQSLKMEEWKQIFLEDGYKKRGGAVIHILDKTELKTKSTTKDKGGHRIMIQ